MRGAFFREGDGGGEVAVGRGDLGSLDLRAREGEEDEEKSGPVEEFLKLHSDDGTMLVGWGWGRQAALEMIFGREGT